MWIQNGTLIKPEENKSALGMIERSKARKNGDYRINVDTVTMMISSEELKRLENNDELSVLVVKDCRGDEPYFNQGLIAKHGKPNPSHLYEARIVWKGVDCKVYMNIQFSNYYFIEVYGLYQYHEKGMRDIKSVLKRILLSKIYQTLETLYLYSFDVAFDIKLNMLEFLYSNRIFAFTHQFHRMKGRTAYVFNKKGEEPITDLSKIETLYLQKLRAGVGNKIVVYDKKIKNHLYFDIVRIEKTIRNPSPYSAPKDYTSAKLLEYCLAVGNRPSI